jgi:hypothetical protein
MMAAKSLVPMSPPDMISTLFLLTFDSDPAVKSAAEASAKALPERILSTALRDEGVKPPVLGYFMALHGGHEPYAHALALNSNTPDESVAGIAATCTAKVLEIISQNQLRLLRHEDIIRQLCRNPQASKALIDSVCDFAVRSGVVLPDVPQIQEARVRLFGPEKAKQPVDPGPTAEEILKEFSELSVEGERVLEEGKRLTLTQRVMKMSVSQKIKLATLGNKEARGLLIRDSNKLVSVAVVRSPRITDGEVLTICNNRSVQDEVLRIIYNNREWVKAYPIKLALVKHPKMPLSLAMKYLATLRESEVKDLSRNKNVPSGIQMHARKMLDKKSPGKKED